MNNKSIPINPGKLVSSLQGDPAARVEVSRVVPIADDGVFEVQRITFPTKAASTGGDFFIVENKAGLKMAVWLDKGGSDVEPAGTLYTAADVKVRADIHLDTSAIQVAARVAAAMTAGSPIAALTRTDNLDGTIDFTATKLGNVTAPVVKNVDESGVGSITAATVTGGVQSSLQNDYISLHSGATLYHAWMNVNSEGVDPAPGGSTAIAVAIVAGSTKAVVAAAIQAAIDADLAFAANLHGIDEVEIHDGVTGNVTDIDAGTSAFTVSAYKQGQAVGSSGTNAGDSPSSISNDPAAT